MHLTKNSSIIAIACVCITWLILKNNISRISWCAKYLHVLAFPFISNIFIFFDVVNNFGLKGKYFYQKHTHITCIYSCNLSHILLLFKCVQGEGGEFITHGNIKHKRNCCRNTHSNDDDDDLMEGRERISLRVGDQKTEVYEIFRASF